MYRLELSKSQAETLCTAAEIFARIGMGQIGMVLDYLPSCPSYEQRREVERVLGIGQFGGITTAEGSISLAWDLYQVIRYRLSWDKAVEEGVVESADSPRKWPEMMQVWYDNPVLTGEEPLAKMEEV